MNKKIWRDIQFKTSSQILEIRDELLLPDFFYCSLIDSNEMAHYRYYKNKLYIIINFPFFSSVTQDYHTSILALIIDDHTVISIHDSQIDFSTLDFSTDLNSYSNTFIGLMSHTLDTYALFLKKINSQMKTIEKRVLNSPSNAVLTKLFTLQKSIILFQTSISGLKNIYHSIGDTHKNLFLANGDWEQYRNIEIEIEQITKTLSIYDNILASEMSLSSSILANNLSKTMKTLTAITIVISIPTLITGFYGMNITLPFQEHPNSLAIVSIFSLIITFGTIYYLYHNDLF
ncbi:MAG: magnesium transporter CorA family protein [Culicoidibacterales bacterium]